MTHRVRWECPAGLHPAVLGASRPRKDATCRYCLPCSTSNARLVLRTAPVVEARRHVRKNLTAIQAAKRRERERAADLAYYTACGVDVRDELANLLNTSIAREKPPRRPPWLHIIRRTKSRGGGKRYGLARYGDSRITLHVWPEWDVYVLRAVLAHELAHLLTPGASHGPAFKHALHELIRSAFSVHVEIHSAHMSQEIAVHLRSRAVAEAAERE